MKLFWTFFISYMVTLLIPLLFSVNIYVQYEGQLRQSIVEEDTRRLLGAKHAIDSGIGETGNIAELVGLTPDLAAVSRIRDPFNRKTIYSFVRAIKNLPNYSLTNSLVKDYFIYLKNGDAVINYHFLYDFSKFSSQYLQLETFPGESLREAFWNPEAQGNGVRIYPAQDIRLGSSESRAVPCFYPLGGPVNGSAGSILILLDDSAYQSILQPLLTYQGSAAFIVDGDGTVITGAGDQWEALSGALPLEEPAQGGHKYQDINGEEMLLISLPSDTLDWSYVLMEPVDKILAEANSFRNLNLLTILGIFLLGMALSAVFALSKYEPIRALVQYLDTNSRLSKKRGESEIHYIRTSLEELNEDNKQMKGRITEQQPLLINAFLLRLFQGRFLSRDEFAAHASLVDFPAEGYFYTAVLVCDRFHGRTSDKQTLAECQEGRSKLGGLLDDEKSPAQWYLCEVDDRRTALLCAVEQYEETWFQGEIRELARQMNTGEDSRYLFLVSGCCRDPLQIPNAFTGLTRAADIGGYNEAESAVFPGNPPPDAPKTEPFYSVDIEEKLMSAMKSGDERLLRAALNEIYRRNFMEQTLPGPMLQMLLCQLFAALIKSARYYNLPLDNYQNMMEDWNSGNELLLHQKITQSFLTLCRSVGEKNQEQECGVIARIEAYIRQNFSDPDLSLKLLSEKFHISPAYLSHLYKQKSSMNLAEYIESLRLQRAKELLETSAFPIEVIAQEVGYSSHNTFSRAFKRYTGLSATEYRRNARQAIERIL